MYKNYFGLSFETKVEIKPYDSDVANHVNNIVYIRWLEDLRIKLFDQFLPISKLLEEKIYLVVISTDIKYKKQLTLFDEPTGKIKLTDYSHGIFTLNAEISVSNKIAFTAIQKCILMDLTSGKMLKKTL